jgi:uncharacterized membrane protein
VDDKRNLSGFARIWKRLWRVFLKGLVALLPTILTIYIIVFAYQFVRDNVGSPINSFMGHQVIRFKCGQKFLIDHYEFDPKVFAPDTRTGKIDSERLDNEIERKFPTWPGLLVAVAGVLVAGVLIASFVGRRLLRAGEHFIARVPVVKVIYPYAKQVTEFVFSEKRKVRYSQVVAVEFPRPGAYCIGFVTGDGLADLRSVRNKTLLNVFVPCSPAPMSGFAIIVPADDVIFLSMTVDEAMRFIISAGVIVPEGQLTPEGKKRLQQDTEMLRLEIEKMRGTKGLSGSPPQER